MIRQDDRETPPKKKGRHPIAILTDPGRSGQLGVQESPPSCHHPMRDWLHSPPQKSGAKREMS